MNEYQQTVSGWLAAAGKQIDQKLALGEDGHCTLECDGFRCILEVPEDSDILFIYAPLRRLPDDPIQQNGIMRTALETNLFGLKTGGGTLGIDTRSDYITYTFSARIDMLDEDLFTQVLGDFLDIAARLYGEFLRHTGAGAASSSDAGNSGQAWIKI